MNLLWCNCLKLTFHSRVNCKTLSANARCGNIPFGRLTPPDLVKAHAFLDALVDKAYGLSP